MQSKHNWIKNPNWPEVNRLLFTSVAKDLKLRFL